MLGAQEIAIFRKWLYSRIPLVGGWFRRRVAEHLAADGSPDAVTALAEAVARSSDARVRAIASGALHQMEEQACIDAFCTVWESTRHPELTALLVEHRWVASAPVTLQVLCALQVERLDLLAEIAPEAMGVLLQACADADASLGTRARSLLENLENQQAIEALCRILIEQDHPTAWEIALRAGYMPRDTYQRALFLFTEQWDRYEALDFDRSLLRAVHGSAAPALRQRIGEKLRAAGKTEFLTVLVGADFRSRAGLLSDSEADVLVQMLAANREWQKLWALAFELSLAGSMRIILILADSGWRPSPEDERDTFAELAHLAATETPVSAAELEPLLPPAVQRARARVSGRVNDVAFSPSRPMIAIGTGTRRVVLWDLQRGAREAVLDGFDHSVGRVVVMPGETLLCGERTNTHSDCAIYGWRDGKRFKLAGHAYSVTGLEAVNEEQVLSAGRDGQVALWDVTLGRKLHGCALDGWARSARVSPDAQHVALLNEGVALLTLPQLNDLVTTPAWASSGVSRCGAFAPDGKALIVGKFNGTVVVCRRRGPNLMPDEQPLTRHERPVQGIEVLPERSLVVTAGAEGSIRFTAWADRTLAGHVRIPGERLTSMRVSPDGSFMAVGESDESISLWDLRVLDVPMLLERPLAHAVPVHLPAVSALAGETNLDLRLLRALQYLLCLLRHRFRYDIEIDEVATLRAGEFDIEIE